MNLDQYLENWRLPQSLPLHEEEPPTHLRFRWPTCSLTNEGPPCASEFYEIVMQLRTGVDDDIHSFVVRDFMDMTHDFPNRTILVPPNGRDGEALVILYVDDLRAMDVRFFTTEDMLQCQLMEDVDDQLLSYAR